MYESVASGGDGPIERRGAPTEPAGEHEYVEDRGGVENGSREYVVVKLEEEDK